MIIYETKSFPKRIEVKASLEKITGLYSIDLVFLEEADPKFRDLIFETGKVIYEQK